MAADDPIIVTRENQQEAESLEAVRRALRPWRLTAVDGRDDVGRDGFFQIHEAIGDRSPNARATSLTFYIQIRSHDEEFNAAHVERLDTRHLALWSARDAHCTVLMVWSRQSNTIRWRTARDLRSEIDALRPDWREHDTVGVELRRVHQLRDLGTLRRSIADESDRDGGVNRFHSACRRVILTDIFHEKTNTSAYITFRDDDSKEQHHVLLGPSWEAADLDPSEIDGLIALASAVLLYEEIWAPLSLVQGVLNLLGKTLFKKLVINGRLRFWTLPGDVGFGYPSHPRNGECCGDLGILSPESPDEHRNSWIQKITKDTDLAAILLRAVRSPSGGMERSEAVMRESQKDLNNPVVRQLLGISPASQRIPIWDDILANRVAHLNSAMVIGEEFRADVIEYEGGLSRLASEKFYSNLRFDRIYDSARALDAVLRAGGLPDVGSLVRSIGRKHFFESAISTSAQDFRDWFWESVATLDGSGAEVDTQFIETVNDILGFDVRAMRAMQQLKLRFIRQTEVGHVVGAPFNSLPLTGFSTRTSHPDQLIKRQALNHFRRRRARIRQLFGREPKRTESCPCRSGEKYRFCCGRQPG